MAVDPAVQIFVRNEQGKVWGPISAPTIELLIDSGAMGGKLLASLDGVNFQAPGLLPTIREVFPKECWGNEVPSPKLSPPSRPRPPVTAPGGPPKLKEGVVVEAAPKPTGGNPAEVERPSISAPRPVVAPSKPSAPRPPDNTADVPAEGDLKAYSPIALYYRIAASDRTGTLKLEANDRTFEVAFKKGNPERVTSTHPSDGVGPYLVKIGILTPPQLAQAEAAKSRFAGDLAATLFGLQLLNPATAFTYLVQHATTLLFSVVATDHGRFSWVDAASGVPNAFPLGNKWALLVEQVRRLPSAHFALALTDAVDLPIMKSGGLVGLADLRLNPQETRAYSFFDGVRSLNELAAVHPQDRETMMRVAFFLKELDGVSFAAVKRPPPVVPPPAPPAPVQAQAPAPAPAPVSTSAPVEPLNLAPAAPQPVKAAVAPKPVDKTPTPAPAPTVDFAKEGDVLETLLKDFKGKTHFEVMGLSPSADAVAVKKAYFLLAKQYHPDTIPADAPDRYSKLRADVFSRIGEANRILSDDKARAAYVEDVKAGNVGEQVDVGQILKAEDLFQKGSIMVKAKKFADAVRTLNEAIALNPEEGEYYSWRGYARFFAATDREMERPNAMADFQESLRRNDKVAATYYFMGHIARVLSDPSTAKKHFQKCLELSPKHIDAQRELRLLK